MARKGGLGKGLEALIPSDFQTSPEKDENLVLTHKIIPNPRQPRAQFDDASFAELVASIQEHGILQPLLVTYDADIDRYTLIAGERRLRAAILAGLKAVPVIIRQATSEKERLELALIENLQRSDLTPLETADAYRQLVEDFNLIHEEIATRVGKDRSSVTNTLRLLKLPVSAKQALNAGKISEGHARAILSLATPQAQAALLESILLHDLNVRQAEEQAHKQRGERPVRPSPATPQPEVVDIENRLHASLGTPVKLTHGKKGGRLTLYYYSDEELDAILNRLLQDDA